jgi:hypothetical protein
VTIVTARLAATERTQEMKDGFFGYHLEGLLQHDGVVTISNKTAYGKLQTKDLSE